MPDCAYLFVPDTHSPYVDHKALKALYRRAEALEPARIIHLGDLFDCYLLSKYAKNPKVVDKDLIRRERTVASEALTRLAAFSANPVEVLEGNHEARMRSRLSENLYLAWYVKPQTLELPGVKFLERDHLVVPTPRGRVLVQHGHTANGMGGAAAATQASRMSVVQGHSHRAGLIWRGQTFGMECGYLGAMHAPCFEYYKGRVLNSKDWRHAFGWIDDEGIPHLEPL